MTEDRRTKPGATPGEDPREIDQERRSDQALEDQAGQDGIVHPQEPKGGLGTSSDAATSYRRLEPGLTLEARPATLPRGELPSR